MLIENKKSVYIMSLDASDIYCHQHRNMEIKKDYYGMIPFSLELIKLHETGLKTKYIEKRDKYLSDDIINVQFKTKAKSIKDTIEDIDKQLVMLDNDQNKEKNQEKKEFAKNILLSNRNELEKLQSQENIDVQREKGVDQLRQKLYSEGFKIKFKNPRTGNIKEVEYVVYKRSSAKSRTGQCLFIKKPLYKKMISWSRMKLPFRNGQKVDLAGLLAYESLVGSSIEDTIYINPDNILIVDDVDSEFRKIANVVKKDEKTGFLNSFRQEEKISNSLFDGESLLDSSFFKNGQAMMLLRNHMFKSASFNTNLELFFKDNVPENERYETWTILDMFGEPMKVKDIKMIITPNSLKALKFKDVLKTRKESEMWKYWKNIVKEDGSIFGICKHEKSSKLGVDSHNNLIQQTSYQMINCLPVDIEDIKDLTKTERDYIDRLKNDTDFLIKEVRRGIDETNSNEAIADLYFLNKNFAYTQLFKNFKRKFVFNKVSHAKKGKIKLNGDYCVLLGNPLEFLYHSIGRKILESSFDNKLKKNEVYTTLFEDGEELACFRNPNTSPSNVLYAHNKRIESIDRYFNLTKNIVVVNAINFEIQDILSGADYDSDTMLISNDKTMSKIAKKCMGDYLVCINKINGDKKEYKLTKEDHYEIDRQLSSSQRIIGRVVNLGQLCMSAYWDAKNNGKGGLEVEELLKKVDVMTVLSGIAIDMAKKFYDIEMMSEILNVQNNGIIKERKKKPNFWIYVSQNKKIKDNIEEYLCPMDYLIKHLNNDISPSEETDKISFNSLIRDDLTTKKVDKRQIENIEKLLEEYEEESRKIKANEDENSREKLLELESYVEEKMKRWKLKAETMSVILKEGLLKERFTLRLIKILHSYHKEEFFKVFKTYV